MCSISHNQLLDLISESLVPEPSYIVTSEDVFISKAFGEFPAQGATPAQYFHPANAYWVRSALNIKDAAGRGSHSFLKRRFKTNFASALAELNTTIFRLRDSFADSGQVIKTGLHSRTESAWENFQKGVFSLCIVNPSSEYLIAKKEVLQEALNHFENKLSVGQVSAQDAVTVHRYIELYKNAAMPFSPPEYPVSSRKKLGNLCINLGEQIEAQKIRN